MVILVETVVTGGCTVVKSTSPLPISPLPSSPLPSTSPLDITSVVSGTPQRPQDTTQFVNIYEGLLSHSSLAAHRGQDGFLSTHSIVVLIVVTGGGGGLLISASPVLTSISGVVISSLTVLTIGSLVV